ncbi:sulfatase [Qipengyuania sp. 1NDW9]|uniref:sulfatase n=1 Tax=Qipengyuania xiapuensis TaxID=2867236 RepID=UPI001C877017|nr:sulfatase [Qipengyuania xiapuensis]MBX7491904.1 sulfatase [Qipengyuania xiapuensis]
MGRKILRCASVLALAAFTSSCGGEESGSAPPPVQSVVPEPSPTPSPSQRPLAINQVGGLQNVLVIMVDDLRTEVGAYGSPVARTPHIDQLAREGATFDNAYVSFAACTPSRMSFLTGRRPTPDDIALRDGFTVNRTFSDGVTLPDLFKAQGFRTLSFGKVYHYERDDADAWSERFASAEVPFLTQHGFRDAEGKMTTPTHVWNGSSPLPDEINVAAATNAMAKFAAQPERLFMAVGIHRPHLNWIATETDWASYNSTMLPRVVNPEGQIGAPPYAMPINSEFQGQLQLRDFGNDIPEDVAVNLRHGYMASVTHADRMVGRLLEGLREAGLDHNTAVILWSDHGYRLGDNGRWGKWSVHTLDTRVPLIMRVPTLTKPGRRVQAVVETVDLFPSIADLMGLTPPETAIGRSVKPLLEGAVPGWRNVARSFTVRPVPENPLLGDAVNTARFRYTVWTDKTGKVLSRELYDKEIDPDESINRIDDPGYTDVVGWLESLRV